MIRTRWLLMGVAVIAFVVAGSSGLVAEETKTKAKVEMPEAVAKAFKAAFPKAEDIKVDVDKEEGVTVYDIEFKVDTVAMETDIAADGTILEVSCQVDMKDVPAAAASAIKKAAEGATIKQVEKVTISYEIKKVGDAGKVVKLDKPKTQYEAELSKGDQEAEITVAADGTVVEQPKWKTKGKDGDKEETEEKK